MFENIHYFNLTLGISAIILQIVCVFTLILLFVVSKENKLKNNFLSFISENFLLFGLLFSIFTTVLSLFYSEVLDYAPCFLCWFQRVFFFPQVILFGVAYFKKDKNVTQYALPLISIGLLFALYHNFIYYFGESSAPCDASGVSCVQRLVNEIGGYASIPVFSLTMFFAFLTLLLVVSFYKKENS